MDFFEKMESLRGLTVPQARARLKAFGHDGQVTVEEDSYYHEDCRQGTVCEVGHAQGIVSMHTDVTLVINRTKLDIAAPSP